MQEPERKGRTPDLDTNEKEDTPVASVPPLTDLTVADLWKEVKDEATLWGDVSRETLRTVKLLLENRMHDELVNHLNAGR